MISKFALNGYVEDHDANCRCEGYYRTLNAAEARRIVGWINLLRHIECKVTPDVVAVYLMSTHQEELLRPFVFATGYNWDPTYTWSPDGSGTARPCCTGLWYDRNENVSKTVFPPELYKMAESYLRFRLGDFIDVVANAFQSRNQITIGTMIPKRVYNVIKSFNPVIGHTINNAISTVKMFNASVMPNAVYGGYTCCGINKYSSLKWDPTTSRNNCQSREDCDTNSIGVDSSIIDNFSKFCQVVFDIAYFLKKSVRENTPLPLFKDALEAFCYGCESMLYINGVIRGGNGTGCLNLPEIESANKFYFKDKLDANGKPNRDYYDNYYRYAISCANVFKSVSAEAALCIGDAYRNLACDCDQYNRERYRKFFDTICHNDNNAVVSFIMNEVVYSSDQAYKVKRMIANIKGDKGCCKECDPCAR